MLKEKIKQLTEELDLSQRKRQMWQDSFNDLLARHGCVNERYNQLQKTARDLELDLAEAVKVNWLTVTVAFILGAMCGVAVVVVR